MSSSSSAPLNCTMGWKLYSYLEKYPKNYDVTFSVGPEKTIVKALKIILRSSSPVFEKEFEECWEQAVLKEGEGIPLPDFDPVMFKLFVKLMILDTWSVDALKALKLTSNQLLHLMKICQKYEVIIAVQSLMEIVKELLGNFDTYVKTAEFLRLSQQELESVLASDDIMMSEQNVCQFVCKWADEQCQKQNLEITSSNRRQVLGSCLYQIRFPLMSCTEFANVTRLNKGLLSTEETIEIFQLIGTEEKEKRGYDTKQLKFKFGQRRPFPTAVPKGCSVVFVVQEFPVVDTPFICDGSLNKHNFNTNMKMQLRGCGFVGPIDADSFYDVTVQIRKTWSYMYDVAHSVTMEKRIFAQKSNTFYFVFDQPVILEPIPNEGYINNNYYILSFTLKGPNTRSLKYNNNFHSIYNEKTKFKFTALWKHAQMVEILYNTC